MDGYLYIAATVLVAQSLFVYTAFRNYLYVRAKSVRPVRFSYKPQTALTVPCKGLEAHFETNVRSLLTQDYENFRLQFVVESESDPAYERLNTLVEQGGPSSRAAEVRILVAGPSQSRSQKIHNLLYAIRQVPDDTEVLAFADSDVCVHETWLASLVQPLRQTKCGLATGYRWFVPTRDDPATLALSAINGAVAQFLGNSPFNQAWGGSMAIRRAEFDRLGIAEIWSSALSDDLSLSRAVRRAGMRIRFVPRCLVASFESTTWRKLFEFGRRQFLITRVYTPITWWTGLSCSLGSVLGLWGTMAVAAWAVQGGIENAGLYFGVPILFLAGQLGRAAFRQLTAARVFPDCRDRLKSAATADLLFFWLWSLVLLVSMLSSAFGRTIRWRGIRYRLNGPTDVTILSEADAE